MWNPYVHTSKTKNGRRQFTIYEEFLERHHRILNGKKRICILCLGFCELPEDEQQSSARDVGRGAGEGPGRAGEGRGGAGEGLGGDGEGPGGAGVRGRPCHRYHQQGK